MFRTTNPSRVKPAVEALENRDMPAVMFSTYASGTWAYNTDTAQWRHIEVNKAVEMTEGADGILYATYTTGGSYNVGTWRYNYWSGSWTKLTDRVATDMDAANDNTLFLSLPAQYLYPYRAGGTYRYTSSSGLQLVDTIPASEIAAVDVDTYFASYGSSNTLWRYDQGISTFLGNAAPEVMAASADGTLMTYLDGYGTYTWTPWEGWQLRTYAAANSIAGKVGNKFIATYGNGVFSYDLTTGAWEHLDGRYASQVAIGQSGGLYGDLFATFADGRGTTVYRQGDLGGWWSIGGTAEQIAD
jgi:hypothetical protein